jgi:hypothetical protein
VNEGLEFTSEEIKQAFRQVFPQGPGQSITTVTVDLGCYFLPIPANVEGYVRCKPKDH